MAIVSHSSSNWIFSLKVLLFSGGVLSMAVILKLSVPLIFAFAVSEVPLLWSSLLSWLRPPYLYVVINGIIITIAASSRFQQKDDEQEAVVPLKIPSDVQPVYAVSAEYDSAVLKNPVGVGPEFGYDAVVMRKPVENRQDFLALESPKVYGRSEARVSEAKDEDDFVISRSSWTPQRRDPVEIPSEYSFVTEKPLVSVRFGHRKTVKASPEAVKALGVSKPRRQDTLESTWKTITEGRPMPLARHLKKSDTWETRGRHNDGYGHQDQSPVRMKKSETFNDRNKNPASSLSPGSGKLRKEASLSQDELNRRVEAFIKKFNEEMRLQRQESLNQYKEMVNRGTH